MIFIGASSVSGEYIIPYGEVGGGWGGGEFAIHFHYRTMGRIGGGCFSAVPLAFVPKRNGTSIRFKQMQPGIYHTACHSRTFDLNLPMVANL